MHQNFSGANIRTGSGGYGGRGGDVGSYNQSTASTKNSHNDNSYRQRVTGDLYDGPVDQGDKYNGPISNSNVGGRKNNNSVNNYSGLGQGNQATDSDLAEQLRKARERLAAKKEKEQRQQMEEELRRIQAELGED